MDWLDKMLTPPPLIARALQIEALQRVLLDTRAGNGRCLLLSGDAGVGKSRLLRAFSEQTDAALILQGHCFESDQSLAYAPLVDALRRYISPQSPDALAGLLGHLAPELIKLLPELILILPDVVATPQLEPELEKRRLFESLVQFLQQLAIPGPLLLILEDIHWCDETSLEFLHLLARRLSSMPILLLLTTRPESDSPALVSFLAQVNRERLAQEIPLQPLSREAVDGLLRAMFDWKQPVKQPLLNAIYELTEGNPFFIEEVASALVASGDIFYANQRWQAKPLTQLPIPHSLRLIVQQRTSHLSTGAANLLVLAAVARFNVDFDLLKQLTGHDEGALLALIKELVSARLVVEAGDTFAFRHALTREAIYSGLLSRERQHWHRVMALHFEQQAAEPAHLAYHFYEAGIWDRALRYSQAAGEQALRQFAPHMALVHFGQAAHAAGRLEQALPLAAARLRGQARQMVGDFDGAQADYEAALAAARLDGNRHAEWQALHDLGFLWMARDYKRTGEYLRQALALARRLGDTGALAQSLNRLGNWQANIGQPVSALLYHQEALAIVEMQQNESGIAATHDLIATAYGIAGNNAASSMHYRHAIPLYEKLNDRKGLASSLMMLTISGDIESGQRALDITREIGWRDGEAYAHLRLAMAFTFTGAFGTALEHGWRGLTIAQEIGHVLWQVVGYQILGLTHLFMLSLAEADSLLELARQMAQSGGAQVWVEIVTSIRVLVRIEQGNVAGAAALVSDADGHGLDSLGQRFMMVSQGEVALAQGRPEAALALVEGILAALPDLHAWQDRSFPFIRHLQGRALAACDRIAEALTVLSDTAEVCEADGLLPLAWRFHTELARFHLGRRDRTMAEAELDTARQQVAVMAGSIPNDLLRQQFEQATSAILPALPELTSLQQRKQTFDGLTQREREVAALVAQGKSNREIAHELVITVRTTKSHITNILTKLDFTSRAQIAVWAAGKGLLD